MIGCSCSSRTVVLLEDGPTAGPEQGLDARIDQPRGDLSTADLPRADLPGLPGSWAISAGGAGLSYSEGHRVATDSAGNAYVSGVFSGTVTFGATVLKSKGRDLFVAKVSPSGKFLWALGAGVPGEGVQWTNLAVDSKDNVYITGYWTLYNTTNPTMAFGKEVVELEKGHFYHLVAKVSPAGDVSWVAKVELAEDTRCWFSIGLGYKDSCPAIAVDGDGSTYITSCFAKMATFGSTVLTAATYGSNFFENVYVARLSPSGSFQWAISSSSTNHDGAYGIAVDGSGNVIVAGGYAKKGLTTLGTTVLKPKEFGNLFLARVSPAGTFLSATSLGSAPSGFFTPQGFGLDSGGNAFLTGKVFNATIGSFPPANGSYVVKVSSAGTPLWVTSTGVWWVYFFDVAVDGTGAAHTTGSIWWQSSNKVTIGKTTLANSTGAHSDAVVVKTSPTGTIQSAFSSTGTHSRDNVGSGARGFGITLDSSDNTYVVGVFDGKVTFGSTTLTSTLNNGIHRDNLFIWRIPAANGSDAGP